MSAQEHWKRTGLVNDLNNAIRENPLAAGLITAGAIWMLLGRKGVGAVAGGIGAAAVGAGHVAGKAGSAAFDSARSAASAVGSAGSSLASTVASAGSNIASTVASAGASGIDKVASIVPDLSADEPEQNFREQREREEANKSFASSRLGPYAEDIKSRLSDAFEHQPLLLGAVGLAIGAAIASSFRTTAIESEWVGEHGAATRESLTQAAKDATDRAWQAGKDEAKKQNLTEEAGWDAAERLAESAESVFKAGASSVKSGVRGSVG